MPVTILITRPEPEAGRFAARLRAVCGPQTEILCAPVMRIAWRGTLPPLRGDEVLIFTSQHGVGGFCALTARRGFTCYCVGEATAEAARAQGLTAIACGGDAAALLDAVAGPAVGDPYWAPPPVRPYAEEVSAPAGRLRIGWTNETFDGSAAVDAEVAAATEATAGHAHTALFSNPLFHHLN